MVPIPLDEEVKLKVSSPRRQWGASWWQQYAILFCRGIKERRHDYFSWLRITQVLSTAIILGLLWWQSDGSSPKGLQDQVSSHCPVTTYKFTKHVCVENFNRRNLNFLNCRQGCFSSLQFSGDSFLSSQQSSHSLKKELC